MKGRKPTTGRYATREALEEWVKYWYGLPGHSAADVAKICRVSPAVVNTILNKK